MNQRIQKLIKQATTIEYGVDNGFDRVTFDKEKFAELIISECAEVSKNYAGGSMPLSIALAIKKHFGVEE
jgi:hypothetical protein